MIQALKNSELGKKLYRMSQHPNFGTPLRVLAQTLQAEAIQPSHLKAANRAHNRKQMQILQDFRARNTPGAKP